MWELALRMYDVAEMAPAYLQHLLVLVAVGGSHCVNTSLPVLA